MMQSQSYGSSWYIYITICLQALNDDKTELRFLLVYLHGMDHQYTEHFRRNTLAIADVINFVNTSMLFWACDTNSAEGYRGKFVWVTLYFLF
jgi:hypothetical protein